MTTDLTNAREFLNAYSQIEHEMQRLLGLKEHRRFFELVDKSARLSPVVERYHYDLREYSELRNAIVHDRAGGEIIAVPTTEVVQKIMLIAALLLEPPKVTPLFLKKVLSFSCQIPVSRAVKEFSRCSYTQAPVINQEGKLVCLLTSNMIVRWMGIILQGHLPNFDETTVLDVINTVGLEKNYELVAVNRSLFDIPALFYQWQQAGQKLEAVLITQNAEADEKLLGIITNRDLPAVQRELGPGS